jgi:hypothetical protein
MRLRMPPLVLGGQCGTQGTFYLTVVPLPTKTSRAFSQFLDNSLFIVFRCCGYIWWCLVMYSIVYMLLGFFFDCAGAGSVRAPVGPTVHCPVIDDVGYQLVAAKKLNSFYLGRGV